MNKTALITGASSGIGKELAIIHAQNKGDLILLARSEDRLFALKNELEQKYGIKVKVIVKDLSHRNAAKEVFNEVTSEGIQVDYLINNAGFGGYGYFHERDMKTDLEMLDVNIVALTQLTRYFLPDMIQRRSGRIMNVSSVAAFMPGPLQAVYFASKAYVSSLSHAIAAEIANTGVTVTAFCPGPVATNFNKVAGLDDHKLLKFEDTALHAAVKGYKAMMKGKREVINQAYLRILIKTLLPFAPQKLVLAIVHKIQKK